MIWRLILGGIFNIIVFSMIGFGPALWLLKAEGRRIAALILSPVMGLTLTTIVGSWLVVLDKPVSGWTWPWVLLAGCGSIGLAWRRLYTERGGVDDDQRKLGLVALTVLSLTAVLLIGPQVVGGFGYSQLRGNGADTLNYVAGAGFVDHETHSSLTLPVQELVDRHQSYLRARNLIMHDRWAAFMLLAFTSRVAGVPIHQFDYCFTLIFFLLAGLMSFLIASRLTMRLPIAALAGIAVSVGFWSQYVLDNRAMSHINSIPVLLGVVWLLARIEERESSDIAWGECVILGIFLGALGILYPETTPLLGTGLALFFGLRLLQKQTTRAGMRGYLFSLGIAAAMTMPVLKLLFTVFLERVRSAANTAVPEVWIKAGLNWLYSDPVLGFWGLSPFTSGSVGGSVVHPLMLVLGAALTLSLACLCIWYLSVGRRSVQVALSLVTCLTIACLVQAGFLLSHQRLWAAGKAFSYGYPFVILAVCGFSLSTWSQSPGRPLRYFVLFWLMVQCALGGYRIGLAYAGKDFDNYLWHHGEYRQHELDFTSFSTTVSRLGHPEVWSYISNSTLSEYAGFALGWESHMISLLPTMDSGSPGAPKQEIRRDGQILITDRKRPGPEDFSADAIVERSSELVMLDMNQSGARAPVVVALDNPRNGVIGAGPAAHFWLGYDPVTVTLVSPTAGIALLKGEFQIGRSTEGRNYAPVKIRTSATELTEAVIVTKDTEYLRVPVLRGINQVSIQAVDVPLQPDAAPAQILGISSLRLAMESPGAAAAAASAAGLRKAYEYTSLKQLPWRPSAETLPGAYSAAFIEADGRSCLEVSATENKDICLIAPLKLSPGLYCFTAVVSGKVDGPASGAGHLSLHGRTKLISIPAGEYSSQLFKGYFNVPSTGLEAEISFGLGGWSVGRGRIVLENLAVEKIW